MAFITKSKARELLHNIRKGEIDGLETDDLYKVRLDILSNHEKNWLAKARELFRNFELFVNKIYMGRVEPKDTFSLLYEGGSSCFHNDSQCGALHSDYHNATIPYEIRHRGKIAVIKFRRWFLENEKLSHTNYEQFIAKMKMDFNITDANLKFYEFPNSGVEEFENETLDSIESKIDGVLFRANDFLKLLSRHHQEIVLTYGDKGNASLESNSDNEILKIWHRFKSDLKKYMLVYFRVKFNKDLVFSQTLLEQLAFRKCQKCANKINDDFLFL